MFVRTVRWGCHRRWRTPLSRLIPLRFMMRDRGEETEPLQHATAYLGVDHDSGNDQLSSELLGQSSESFAGRIHYSELTGLNPFGIEKTESEPL